MRRNNYNYGFSKYGKNTSKFPDFAFMKYGNQWHNFDLDSESK